MLMELCIWRALWFERFVIYEVQVIFHRRATQINDTKMMCAVMNNYIMYLLLGLNWFELEGDYVDCFIK